jgi:hypothetical protein
VADSHIDWLAAEAYARGEHPVDHAVTRLTMLLDTIDTIRAARVDEPSSFPIYGRDTSAEHAARRCVGMLMELGWTPPTPVVPDVLAGPS